MWLFSADVADIWSVSKKYIILVAIVAALSLLSWAEYGWRICRADFKHFSVKWQARISGLLGACIILIILMFWLFKPELFNVACWLTGFHIVFFNVYRFTMMFIYQRIMQIGTLQEQLRNIHATRQSDPLDVQKKLLHWYKKKYSIKTIERYLKDMKDVDGN